MKRFQFPHKLVRRGHPVSRFKRVVALSLGLLCGAAAQTGNSDAPAISAAAQVDSAAVCATSPIFVDTSVNKNSRGGAQILITSSGYWVPPTLLKISEAAYSTQTVNCDDATYVLLNPALSINYSAQELTLDVRPQLSLLPGNDIDLSPTARPTEAVTSPSSLGALSFGVQASLNRSPNPVNVDVSRANPTERLTHNARVSAGYQTGNAQARVEVSEAGNSSLLTLRGNAQVTYDFSDTFHVGAVVYAIRNQDGQYALSTEQLSGLTLRLGSTSTYRLPRLSVDLLLDADVDVLVNRTLVRSFRAKAGVLTLRNIPLTTSSGSVTIRAQDGGQSIQQEFPYTPADVVLASRSAALEARAGLRDGRAAVQATGLYGLSDHLTLAGSLDASTETQTGEFSARYSADVFNLGAGVRYNSAAISPFSIQADAIYTLPHWGLGASVHFPIRTPENASLTARVTYQQRLFDLGLRVTAVPGIGSYAQALSATLHPDLAWTVGAQLAYQNALVGRPQSFQASLNARWTPNRRTTLQAYAGGQRSATSSQAYGAGLLGSYEVLPGQTASAGIFAGSAIPSASLGYTYARNWLASISTSTTGAAQATADLSATLVAGRFYVSRDDPGPGVLIHTGLPNLPLVVGGRAVLTDSSGDALVFLAGAAQQITVTPNLDLIPITISVRDERREVSIARRGVVVLDWRDNFEQRQYVQLLWSDGQPTKYSSFTLADQSYITDDTGYVLIRKLTAPASVTLKADPEDQNSQRQCQLNLVPGSEAQRCPAN